MKKIIVLTLTIILVFAFCACGGNAGPGGGAGNDLTDQTVASALNAGNLDVGTSDDENDIGVKLYSDNDFGNHLIRLMKETDSLEDLHTVVGAVSNASDAVKEQLEEYVLYDQLDNKE